MTVGPAWDAGEDDWEYWHPPNLGLYPYCRRMTREDLGLPVELSMREMWLRDHSDFYPPSLEDVQVAMWRTNSRWDQLIAQGAT